MSNTGEAPRSPPGNDLQLSTQPLSARYYAAMTRPALGHTPLDGALDGAPEVVPSAPVSTEFARLVPFNTNARRCFDELVEAIRRDPDRFAHARRFMHIEEERVPLHPLPVEPQIGASSTAESATTELSSDFDSDSQADGSDAQLVWTGYYRFSLDEKEQPIRPTRGWNMGGGSRRGPGSATNAVDIRLASSRSPQLRLAGLHAAIRFDRQGALLLQAVSARGYSVVLGTDAFTNDQRVLVGPEAMICCGELTYRFCFTVTPTTQPSFERDLAKHLTEHYGVQGLPAVLLTTASASDYILGDWHILSTVGQGVSSTVTVARHKKTATVAAAKLMTRNATNWRHIDGEIALARSLPKHRYLASLIDVLREREGRVDVEGRADRPKVPHERVCLLWTPFAYGTFTSLWEPNVPISDRAIFFKQVLEGLSVLHAHDIIHRDIKPGNLVVASYSPPKGLIIDFGHAIQAEKVAPSPGRCGTVPYLAPEMESATYNNAVDIWACGLVGLQLFVVSRGRLPWNRVSRDMFEVVASFLENHKSVPACDLLRQMLRWDPAKRVSAQDALQHSFLRHLTIQDIPLDQDQPTGSKRPYPGTES